MSAPRPRVLTIVAASIVALGLLAVVAAGILRSDPAPDANIGAGLLLLGGLAVGAAGVLLLLLDLVRGAIRRRATDERETR